MLLKLQHKEESLGGSVKTQMVGPVPEISSSLGLGGGYVKVITCMSNFPGDVNAGSLGTTL